MKMTKSIKERGFPKVNDLVKSFEIGDYVAININPSEHRGMPFHNFQGKTAIVRGKQGESYLLDLKVGTVRKTIIASPVHLRKIEIGKA